MWYHRRAREQHECLYCLEPIKQGEMHVHGDRSPYVRGQHRERGFYFHGSCFYNFWLKFEERVEHKAKDC